MAKTVKVALDELVLGLFIDLQLSWSEHPFSFSKFKIKDQKTLKIIRSLPIEYVLVHPARSDVPVPVPDSTTETPAAVESPAPQTSDESSADDQPAVESISESEHFAARKKRIENNYRKTADQISQMTQNLRDRPANVIHEIDQIVVQMSSIFNDDSDLITQMVNLGNGDFSDQNHILNVTMLSLLLGKSIALDAAQLALLGSAALLHDVGKIKVPLAIRNKRTALTDAENKIYQQHTTAGRQLVEQIKSMHVEVLNAIEQHHEYLDGSGYSKGLKGEQISTLTRIITVANTYDNLCNPADSDSPVSPKVALATLYKNYQGQLDKQLVENLVRMLGVYPPGTVVRLSDGSTALVISGDAGAYMNPNVMIYQPNVPKSQAKMISLADYPDLSIVVALKPGEYSMDIHQYLGLGERIGYMVDSDRVSP